MAIDTGCSNRWDSASTFLLYRGVRRFVWWYEVCVLKLISSTCMILLNSYCTNGCLSHPFLLFYLFFQDQMCASVRVYMCVRGHAQAFMSCSGVPWHTPLHRLFAGNAEGVVFVTYILC